MELGLYLRFFLALLFVVGLLAAFGWLARRHGFGGRLTATAFADRRLSVVEILPIDAKRRLALFRRDNVEHLVLLGTTNDVLIEGGITAPAGAPMPTVHAASGGPSGFFARLKAAGLDGLKGH